MKILYKTRIGYGIIDQYISDVAFLGATGIVPQIGDFYYNSTQKTYKYYDGVIFRRMGLDTPSSTTPNAIVKWSDSSGAIIADTSILIDSAHNLLWTIDKNGNIGENNDKRPDIVYVGSALHINGTESSAVLSASSTTKGVLFPRMLETERDSIINPAVGLIIYNTDSNQYEYYTGGGWDAFVPSLNNKYLRLDGTNSPSIHISWGNVKIINLADGSNLQDACAYGQLTSHTSNTSNPHSVTQSQIGLGFVENLKVNLVAITNPSVNDDSTQSYAIGSRWVNTALDKEYVCVDASIGAAIWKHTTADADIGGQFAINLGLAQGGDASQIKITGATGALSVLNVLSIKLPDHAISGQLVTFNVTADISIDLTGAHWGLDTYGDRTDIELRVYAINDAGTIRYGIANKGGLRFITVSESSDVATNINTSSKMLVNAPLSGTSPCVELSWFNANFIDLSNEWAIQTGIGDLNVGIPVKDHTDWESCTVTGSFTSTNYDAVSRRVGDCEEYIVNLTSIATGAVGVLYINLSSNRVINADKLSPGGWGAEDIAIAPAVFFNSPGDYYTGTVVMRNTTSVDVLYHTVDVNSNARREESVAHDKPFSFGVNDKVAVAFRVPILGWSSN
jgi:hypothetical protein